MKLFLFVLFFAFSILKCDGTPEIICNEKKDEGKRAEAFQCSIQAGMSKTTPKSKKILEACDKKLGIIKKDPAGAKEILKTFCDQHKATPGAGEIFSCTGKVTKEAAEMDLPKSKKIIQGCDKEFGLTRKDPAGAKAILKTLCEQDKATGPIVSCTGKVMGIAGEVEKYKAAYGACIAPIM